MLKGRLRNTRKEGYLCLHAIFKQRNAKEPILQMLNQR